MGYGITDPGTGITDRGVGITSAIRDQGSGRAIFVGVGDQNWSRFSNQGSEIWVEKCDLK